MSSTIFESFNARHLTPVEVASRFIAPSFFRDLLLPNNNILIGPRGSGKTTLLKMLQIPALNSWSSEHADSYVSAINYASVFIPTDITWKSQWSVIDSSLISIEYKDLIKESVFLTHVIRSVIECVRHRSALNNAKIEALKSLSIAVDKDLERKLCTLISDVMNIQCDIPSIEYLEYQFRNRLVDLGTIINRSKVSPSELKYPDFLSLPFLESISAVVAAINLTLKEPDRKWAFLFDELEIAPKTIRQKLISFLRSTADQNLIFKLSISPYSEDFDLFKDASSPSSINDYVPINLWYSNKEEARPFCKQLFKQICKIHGLSNIDPVDAFGNSDFDLGNNSSTFKSGASAYSVGGELYKRFSSLANKDYTFQDYLKRRKVNLDQMDQMEEDIKAANVRKITNIVCVREIFLKSFSVKSTKRRPSLYAGGTTILDITEGNPRLFLGIVSSLVKEYSKEKKQVKFTSQAKSILQASDRFRALLGTIAMPDELTGISNLNILLDSIGEFFHNEIVLKKFNPDPPTCFTVDGNISPAIKEALGKALNAGAIIYMPENPGHALIDSLDGKRFRISNLLAPHYKIPLIASKSRILSNILSDSPKPINTSLPLTITGDLF